MKPPLRIAILFTTALAFVSFLPLYVERTMTRVMVAHANGDIIEWSWKFCTLGTFLSDYRYFRHHPHPGLWIALNIALACIYAVAVAFAVALVIGRWRKHAAPARQLE